MKTLAILFTLIGSCVTSARADFTLEQILGAPFCSNLVSAPEPGVIAWLMNVKGHRNVWVARAPDYRPQQITAYDADDGQALASLRLTPDGTLAVFARGSEINDAGVVANPLSLIQPAHQQVFAIRVSGGAPWLLGTLETNAEGGEDIQLSPDGQHAVWATHGQLWVASLNPLVKTEGARQITFARGSQSEPRWSPDGKHIAFVSERGDHAQLAIYDFDGDRIRYVAPAPDRATMPRWSRDGAKLAFVRLPGVIAKQPLIPPRPTPWSIWVSDANGARAIWQSRTDDSGSFPGWAAASCFHFAAADRIVFASEHDGRNHLYAIAAAGGPAALLTPGDGDVEETMLSADGRVVYTSNVATTDPDDIDRRHLWQVAVEGGTPRQLTAGATIEWSPCAVQDTCVCLGSTATSPAMPYVLRGQGRVMIAKETISSDFPEAELVVPKAVSFKSEDGLTVHGQLFTPRVANGRLPALVFTHGGPPRQMMLGFHYMDYYHNAYAMNQYLASRGYVVLSVNYRLGIMYGRAFREAQDAGWRGSSEYRDVVAGAHYLAALPNVEANKIGLWGGSYGGLLTALGLARNSDLFAAGVDFHGVHDWSAFLSEWEMNPMAAPDAKEAVALAFASSPNASIAHWRSPVLLVQGDDDRNVPASQTVNLVQLLRRQHVPFESLFLPDEIHDFLLHRTWLTAYAATADFFDRVLKRGEPARSE